MSKGFFLGVIFVCFVVVGLLFADSAGVLPQPFYSVVYKIEDAFFARAKSELPYLEKFEGHWNVTFTPKEKETDISACAPMEGPVVVHNGAMVGTIGTLDRSMLLKATIVYRGDVMGTLSGRAAQNGTVQGTLGEGRGSGSWEDSLGCKGDIGFTKLDPVVDPVQGHVVSAEGDVKLVRSAKEEWLYPEQLLYENDVITVGEGSSARIIIGLEVQDIVLSSGELYTVPKVRTY